MSFYIRKALKVGPIRFNLSKSGIGVSAGVKGLRLGKGPRGNYIHMGRGGLYFRQTLHPQSRRAVSTVDTHDPLRAHAEEAASHTTLGEFYEIGSESAAKMITASSGELLHEINHKHKKAKLLPAAFGITLLVLVFLFFGAAISGSKLLLASIGPACVAGGALCWLTSLKDTLRKTTVIMYDLEPDAEAAYANLHNAFAMLMGCSRIWHVEARAQVRDEKYHAGAETLLKRTLIKSSIGAPPFVWCNVQVPLLPVGKQTLAFMPDRLLVFEHTSVGAVEYCDLIVTCGESRFIEDTVLPADSTVVGRTWRYVNKKGGPDRRFKDNCEIPICLYDQVHLMSATGLNIIIQFSKRGVCTAFQSAIWALQHSGASRRN